MGHIFDSLRDGGLLIVGSNDAPGSDVHGAIYRKAARGFERMAQTAQDHDAVAAIERYSTRMI